MAHRVFITILDLRPQSRPGFVMQQGDITMISVDTEATLVQAVDVCVSGLDEATLNQLRAAFGEPAVPHPLSDFWMTDCRVSWELIPDALLVPSDLRAKDEQRELMLGA